MRLTHLTKEQLLAEVEDIIRTMPHPLNSQNPLSAIWVGRVAAAIERWDRMKGPSAHLFIKSIFSGDPHQVAPGRAMLIALVHQAQSDLRMETVGPVNVSVSHKMVFEYFDEIRKIIELAQQDLLFVDPYLDAEFVSRYLPIASAGVRIRLLASEKLGTLIPAVQAWTLQSGKKVEIRSAPGFHDRYVFVDKVSCYQSGASFKDGAKKAPTSLTQITDAFAAMLKTYEDIWAKAKVEF